METTTYTVRPAMSPAHAPGCLASCREEIATAWIVCRDEERDDGTTITTIAATAYTRPDADYLACALEVRHAVSECAHACREVGRRAPENGEPDEFESYEEYDDETDEARRDLAEACEGFADFHAPAPEED